MDWMSIRRWNGGEITTWYPASNEAEYEGSEHSNGSVEFCVQFLADERKRERSLETEIASKSIGFLVADSFAVDWLADSSTIATATVLKLIHPSDPEVNRKSNASDPRPVEWWRQELSRWDRKKWPSIKPADGETMGWMGWDSNPDRCHYGCYG